MGSVAKRKETASCVWEACRFRGVRQASSEPVPLLVPLPLPWQLTGSSSSSSSKSSSYSSAAPAVLDVYLGSMQFDSNEPVISPHAVGLHALHVAPLAAHPTAPGGSHGSHGSQSRQTGKQSAASKAKQGATAAGETTSGSGLASASGRPSQPPRGTGTSSDVIMAYGGPVGLLRVHSVNLREEICGGGKGGD